MITNPAVVSDVRQSWSTIKKLSSEGLFCGVTLGGWFQLNRPNDAFNLPFVLAYACLDQVLNELRDQGAFACRSSMLGPKMEASELVLPWQGYAEVLDGKDKRNLLAHEGLLVSKAEALRFIKAIEREFRAWNIL